MNSGKSDESTIDVKAKDGSLKRKPHLNDLYNTHKFWVDAIDQLCSYIDIAPGLYTLF